MVDDSRSRADDAIVGIDLGTTNSVVATVIDGRAEVIRDPEGRSLHPSVVAFLPNGLSLVGHDARERRLMDPFHTIFSAKRIIGRPFHSPETLTMIAQLPYRIVEGENQEPIVETRAGAMPVIDISARVLKYLRELAENKLGKTVGRCVVTVPANFSDGQREATRRAAERAGMEVLRILNEPTAAARALGLGGRGRERIAVYDLGGGTFDLTVLAVHDDIYEVLATDGEPFLGGDDFDNAIANQLADGFLRRHRVDLNADHESRARLFRTAEAIKIALSEQEVAQGTVGSIAYGEGGIDLDLEYRVTRAELDALIGPQISRTLELTLSVLSEANLTRDDIDQVALVGGSTLIPLVRSRVAALFGKDPHTSVNPLEVVAAGAALQAHAIGSAARRGQSGVGLLMDVTSHALGILTAGGTTQFIIDKNTPIPAEGSRLFTTAEDNQGEVQIRICQGKEERFDDNTPLGQLRLTGLRPAPRGQVQVDVQFLVNADGILQVSARDVATGNAEAAVLSVLGIRDKA